MTVAPRAIVLAGGKGTRLAPYTATLPKPLVPLGDMPILEILLRQLARVGLRHVTLTVNHLAALLEAYFGDGAKFGLEIDYTLEETPL
ncbi:MAG: sugar phosphate nucleotidyltransferase, partial [Gammaproteobacteria bacterium]